MPVAAMPKYLIHNLSEMPPGHRYGAFFPVWTDQSWLKAEENKKNEALKIVFAYEKFQRLSESLLARQKSIAKTLGEAVFSLPAESVSPFMTGIGMEHPLENGFAFLNPYGLPYLPGSGIKGVLRRTAEYMRDKEFGDTDFVWDQPTIDALFGPESKDDENAQRGALVFWDVYIKPRDYKLDMDILTPHFGKYYAGEETPHESGQPVPVPFLVVPPGAVFNFHIQCNSEFIQNENLKANWRDRAKTLLEHSFDWLGFGAKTAGGYGGMRALSEDEINQIQNDATKAALRCDWVDKTINELMKKNFNAKEQDTLRGKSLAEAWRELADPVLKSKALKDIRSRWEAEGWWDAPPGKAAKIKQIYES